MGSNPTLSVPASRWEATVGTNEILTLALGAVGATVALATFATAGLEYLRRGKLARAQMFFELRARLKEPELAQLSDLIDQAAAPERELSAPAERELIDVPLRTKRAYLGLFEEVALAMEWGLIEPEIAHYMFGYYALNCEGSRAFWVGVNRWNIYWDRFHKFCAEMEIQRDSLKRELGVE